MLVHINCCFHHFTHLTQSAHEFILCGWKCLNLWTSSFIHICNCQSRSIITVTNKIGPISSNSICHCYLEKFYLSLLLRVVIDHLLPSSEKLKHISFKIIIYICEICQLYFCKILYKLHTLNTVKIQTHFYFHFVTFLSEILISSNLAPLLLLAQKNIITERL